MFGDLLIMDRITLRMGDELSGLLSREAARCGVSRARWVREVVIAELARQSVADQVLNLDARLRVIEQRLGLATRSNAGVRGLAMFRMDPDLVAGPLPTSAPDASIDR